MLLEDMMVSEILIVFLGNVYCRLWILCSFLLYVIVLGISCCTDTFNSGM